MKVLILSTGTGEGHNSAAKAVKEQFERRNIPCELADVLDFASDKASAYRHRIYIWSTVRAKKAFAGAYRAGRAISSARLKSPVYFANALYAGYGLYLHSFYGRDGRYHDTGKTGAFAGSGGTGENAPVSGKIREALCRRCNL